MTEPLFEDETPRSFVEPNQSQADRRRAIARNPKINEMAGDNQHETSAQAAVSVRPHLKGLRAQILALLDERPDGLTCSAICKLLNKEKPSISPRLVELENGDPDNNIPSMLYTDGVRNTNTGRKGKVYKIRPEYKTKGETVTTVEETQDSRKVEHPDQAKVEGYEYVRTEPETKKEIVQAPQAKKEPSLWELANVLAVKMPEMIPKGLAGRPEATFALVQYGAELGLSPLQTLQCFNIVEGRIASSSEFKVAQILKAGHKLDIETSPTECKITGTRADSGSSYTCKFDIHDAERAGLCKIVGGEVQARSKVKGEPMPWETYTEDMLYWRCASRIARRLFADVIQGVSYTPEELLSGSGIEEFNNETHQPALQAQPQTIKEAVDVLTEGEIVPEAPLAEVIPATELMSGKEVQALAAERKRSFLTKTQAGELDKWLESKGWSFGQVSDDTRINSYIPLKGKQEVLDKIKELGANNEAPAMTAPIDDTPMATDKQVKAIFAIQRSLSDHLRDRSIEAYKLQYQDKSHNDLTMKEASDFIKYLNSLEEEPNA